MSWHVRSRALARNSWLGFALIACVSLGGLSACRLGSNNPTKLDALKAGLLLDEDGNVIGDSEPVSDSTSSQSGGTTVIKEATDLAVGYYGSCAVVNGGAQCWGYNSQGELGNGTNVASYAPVKVSGLSTGVLQIEVGAQTACALQEDRTVKCWGQGTYGKLGNNATAGSYSPVQVLSPTGDAPLSGVAEISMQNHFACARLLEGKVVCWGRGPNGRLGNNSEADSSLPVYVQDSTGAGQLTSVTAISAGGSFACAKTSDGEARCWGNDSYGQIGVNSTTGRRVAQAVKTSAGTANLTGISKIVAGEITTCAMQVSGEVQCWGYNLWRGIGNNTTTHRLLPTPVLNPSGTANLSGVTRLTGNGPYNTCATLDTGKTLCWGMNDYGQAGSNSTAWSALPTELVSETGSGPLTGITEVGFGRYHACALLADKQVRCWGGNTHSQLGSSPPGDGGITSPITIQDAAGTAALTGVTQITNDYEHGCVLAGGAVQCFGHNYNGQFGNNTQELGQYGVIAQGMSTGVLQIAVSNTSTCARKNDGTVWCWGGASNGQLGQNTTTESWIPLQVKNSAGTGMLTGVTELKRGFLHFCAIASGEVFCWGRNTNGQIGDNTTTNAKLPLKVKDAAGTGTLSGVGAITVGNEHSCALIGGGVQCWGENAVGQLGINSTVDGKLPAPVSGLTTGVVSIQSSFNHTCALKDDNSVWCWGANNLGNLGDGTTTDRWLPTQVTGLPGTVQAITVFFYNTCALMTSGAVYCWGVSDNGAMGAAYTGQTSVTTPTLMNFLPNVSSLQAGASPCLIATDGTARCWGSNKYGKIQQPSFYLRPTRIGEWE